VKYKKKNGAKSALGFDILDVAETVALDAIVAFVSIQKSNTPRLSMR
jgi:hypothetical protein